MPTTRRRPIEALSWLPFLAFAAACECLPEPASDATPPSASVTVEYREPGGPSVTRTLRVGDADITVTAARNRTVAVLYSGGDDEGLRKVDLEYDMRYYTGNTVTQPLLRAIGVSANCPKKVLLDSENFEPGNTRWKYEFAARSTNWLGLTSTSGKIKVNVD